MLKSFKTATPCVRSAVIFTALALLSSLLVLGWLFVLLFVSLTTGWLQLKTMLVWAFAWLLEGDGIIFVLTLYVGFTLGATILSVTATRHGEWRHTGGGKRLLLTLYGLPLGMVLLFAVWFLPLDVPIGYSGVVANRDDQLKGCWWEQVHRERIALHSAATLRKQYEAQTNHFRGTLTVECVNRTDRSVRCFQRTLLCNAASNTFLIAEGGGLTNAVAKPSFEDVLQEVFADLKKEAANPPLKPKKVYTFVLEDIRKWWSED